MRHIENYYWNGEEKSFSYDDEMTANQKASFISTAMALLFSGDSDGEELYLDILYDMFFDYALVLVCSDIQNKDIMESDEDGNIRFSYDTIEDFLNETNVATIIELGMSVELKDLLHDSLDNAIAYKTGISKSEVGYALGHLLKTIESQLKDFDLDSLMEFAQDFVDVAPTLTEEKIVDAYIDRTLNVDGEKEVEEEAE